MGERLPLHVLIADDETVTRFLARAAVERLGHVASLAADGAEALAVFERERPGVVIADWRMPGLQGMELTRRLREHSQDGYTYVIILTSEDDEDAARAAIRAGADDLLVGPVEDAKLEHLLISAERVIELHARLRADVRVDSLTGVPNRRAMDEELNVLRLRALRYGHEMAVVLLGLDRFEAYGAAAGRRGGDDLLRRLAGQLKTSLRGSDSLYRPGGDEFLALLPGQSTETATIVAERLCAAVRALVLEHPAGGFVTISAGVAGLRDGESTEQLLARADGALSAAKQAGRDCVRSDGDAVFLDAP